MQVSGQPTTFEDRPVSCKLYLSAIAQNDVRFTFCSRILDGISRRTIPADSRLVPALIWLVSMWRSSVMVEVRALEMFARSICNAKNASPRIGSKVKSTLKLSQYKAGDSCVRRDSLPFCTEFFTLSPVGSNSSNFLVSFCFGWAITWFLWPHSLHEVHWLMSVRLYVLV
jgi:hypothetical protein